MNDITVTFSYDPKKLVAVLGCGPAGLLAAWAVEQAGGIPVIISRRVRSSLPGAQYLHEEIPELYIDSADIRTERIGTRQGYALKVYGDENAPVSWDLQQPVRRAWNLRSMYDVLWTYYEDRIINANLGLVELRTLVAAFPLVISTLPANAFCVNPLEHRFDWSAVDVIMYSSAPLNTVVYDGQPESSITRTARVFGYGTTEFTRRDLRGARYEEGPRVPGVEVYRPIKAIKVIGTNCDCHSEVVRIGRFGKWSKNYLSHMAYGDALSAYQQLQEKVA